MVRPAAVAGRVLVPPPCDCGMVVWAWGVPVFFLSLHGWLGPSVSRVAEPPQVFGAVSFPRPRGIR